MGYAAQNLRDLLRQAAALRRTAAEAPRLAYATKLLVGAAELEARAAFLAAHPAEPGHIPDAANDAREDALHAHVDITV